MVSVGQFSNLEKAPIGDSCFPYFEMEVSLASSSLILNSVCPFPVIDLGRFSMVFVEYYFFFFVSWVEMSVGQCWAIQQFGKSADLESCFPCFEMEVSLASSSLILDSVCCLLYTSPSPRDRTRSRMPSSA